MGDGGMLADQRYRRLRTHKQKITVAAIAERGTVTSFVATLVIVDGLFERLAQ